MKKNIKFYIELIISIVAVPIYLPHILVLFLSSKKRKKLILSDVNRYVNIKSLHIHNFLAFIYVLNIDSYFRSVFYYRIGSFWHTLIGWYRPGFRSLNIPSNTKIGAGIMPMHPYATFLNAESIGENFTFLQCTTIGKKDGHKPIIGDKVTIGANVVVIGNVKIGNNVIIGAGSVVVKDIPDNSVAVGNPAKVIKKL